MQLHQVQLKQDAQALGHSGAQRSSAFSSAPSAKLPLQTYRTNATMSTTQPQNASQRPGLLGSGVSSKRVSSKRVSSERVSGGRVSGAAVTSVAAVASAGIVMPLTADSAIAYDMPSGESIVPQAHQAKTETAPAAGYQQAMVPQIAQSNRAVFAPGYSAIAERSFAAQATQQSSVGVSAVDVSSQFPVLGKDAAGNWTVSYEQRRGQNTQAVVAQVAKATSGSTAAPGGQYVVAQLPEARRKVAEIQQKIKAFESEIGQADVGDYQRLLNSRIDEISRQQSQLTISLEETRELITQLKMRLVTVNADLSLADQVIAQDMAYQTVWQRLQKSEEALLAEFSKVSIDSEALNGTYADYQYHQQWLQRTVQEALSNYLMTEGSTPPDFIYRAPAALNVMQDLVVATHEYQVQQLRQSTITTISQRLQARRASLLGNVGEYEALQRDLAIAQQVLSKYESAGNSPVVRAATDATVPAVERARTLSLEIPGGSVGKALLGLVAAGGALAAVLARRRSASDVLRPTVLSITPAAGNSSLALFGNHDRQYGAQSYSAQSYSAEEQSIAIAQAAMVAQQPQLSPAYASGATNAMEEDLLHELLAVTGRPAPTLAMTAGLLGGDIGHGFDDSKKLLVAGELSATASPEEALDTAADDTVTDEMVTAMTAAVAAESNTIVQLDDVLTDDELSVERMARELDDVIGHHVTTEEIFEEEVRSRAVEPVHLSLDEIDLFAEQAIRWVLKDLGFVPAESVMAEVRSDVQAGLVVQTEEPLAEDMFEPEPVDEPSELERALSELALSELPAPQLPAAVAPVAAGAALLHGRHAFPARSALNKRDEHVSSAEVDEAIAKAYAESWETVAVG